MQQIKLMSKLGLALIAITAISVSVATQAYYIQAADAQPKLPNNSVTSQTIVDGEVKTADLASGAVTKEKLNPDAVKLVVVQRSVEFELPPHSGGSGDVQCNSDEVVTGGGFHINGGATAYPVSSGRNDNGWVASGFNTADDTRTGNFVRAECAHLELGP